MKHRTLYRLSVLIFSLFLCLNVFGQQVSFELAAPPVVESGNTFRIEFNLNAKPDDFTPPAFSGVNVIAGPSISQGQSVSIVGTKMTKTVSYSYTYVLQASSQGKITIPSATVVVDGKSYSTRQTAIEVVSGSTGNSSATPQQNSSASQQSTQPGSSIGKDDILIRAIVSSKNVYKGEPIKVSFKLYTRAALSGIDNAKYPAFNGFWTQEINTDDYQWQRETLNNKVYDSRIMKEYILFPQQSGVLQIEQLSFGVVAQIVTQSRRQSIFDDFFGGGSNVQEVRQNVTSQPINITVKNLPNGAPARFDGAVGKFSMEAFIEPTALTANSAATYEIKISGTGNLPLVNAPKIDMPTSFEQYAVKNVDNYKVLGNNITGSKEFSIPFIARAEGNYSIVPVEFSYFDTQSGKYVTLSSKQIDLKISADPTGGAATSGIVSGVSKEDLKILDNDIRFIRVGTPSLNKTGYTLLWSWQYFVALILIIGAFIAVLIYMQKRIQFRSNVTLVKNKRAHKVALKRLKTAEKNMINGNKKEFYEEMLKAMWGYMGDKLNISVAELSRDNIREKMLSYGISENMSTDYINIISECEYAQYSPAESAQIGDMYKRSIDLISNIESCRR